MTEANITPSRICTGCEIEKPATKEFFHAYKRAPDGRRAVCRICRAKDHLDNRDVRLPQRREHYQANRDRITSASREYYANNTEAQREVARKRHQRNADHNNALSNAYYEKHRDRLLVLKRESEKQRFKELYGKDQVFTLRHRVRSLMRVTMTTNKGGRRMQEILGYSYHRLKTHLEKLFTAGMNWDRFMAGEIHIDHRIPVAYFKPEAHDSHEFRMCWSLTNLRPLWAQENIAKSDRLPDDFEELLKELRREVGLNAT